MADDPKPKRFSLDIGIAASCVAVLLGGMALYGTLTANVKKGAFDQLQDDSSYARATRASAWIDQNGWKVQLHFTRDTNKVH